jgi:hypothetical protein
MRAVEIFKTGLARNAANRIKPVRGRQAAGFIGAHRAEEFRAMKAFGLTTFTKPQAAFASWISSRQVDYPSDSNRTAR